MQFPWAGQRPCKKGKYGKKIQGINAQLRRLLLQLKHYRPVPRAPDMHLSAHGSAELSAPDLPDHVILPEA